MFAPVLYRYVISTVYIKTAGIIEKIFNISTVFPNIVVIVLAKIK